MNINQFYNLLHKSGDINAELSPVEYDAYAKFMQSIAPIQKENPELYDKIQDAVMNLVDVKCHKSFKNGFKAASELMLSTFK